MLGMARHKVACLAYRNGITGWKMGAAARNQYGPMNPNYKGGDSRASINRLTKKLLTEVGRDLFKCERCGTTRDVELPRHHKDRDRSNNEIENLEVICVACHNKEHMHERPRNKLGRFDAV